jgi:molybdenum cofactor cytidylyltransferase
LHERCGRKNLSMLSLSKHTVCRSNGRFCFGCTGLCVIFPMQIDSDKKPHTTTKHQQIAAVVLAAGMSSRMGRNKLLANIAGEPLVRRVVRAVEESRARPIVVVTGRDGSEISAALAGTAAKIVHNAHYRDGLSTSLRTGIEVVSESDGAIILLGDMPGITASLIDRIIASFCPGRSICVATYRGKRGHPVLFDRRFYPALRSISGDIGARHVVGANEEAVCEMAADDEAPLIDIDTPEDLARFLERQ